MVAFRICAPDIDGADGETYLIEIGEVFADERERGLQRLPGTKKLPHENIKQVCARFEAEKLAHLECTIEWDSVRWQAMEVFVADHRLELLSICGHIFRYWIIN